MAVKTIILKGSGIRKEAPAAEAIKPGQLVERTSAGKVQMRDTTAATTVLVAIENEVVGKDIDTAYATDDTVLFGAYGTGVEINAWIADGQTIAVGDILQATTGGELIAVGAGAPVAVALAAASPSGAAGRCIVELL